VRKLFVLVLVVLSAIAMFAYDVEWRVEDVTGGVKGGTLYLSSTSGPKTYNPYWAQETSSTDILNWTIDSALNADQKGFSTIDMLAAEHWMEETETGVIYNFRLRKGLKWSDGMPLTVEDWAFTTEKVAFVDEMTANGAGAYKDDNDELPIMKVVDDYTISFEYNTKFRNGWTMLGGMQILPKHIFESKVTDPDTFAQTWTLEQLPSLVASGPFMVTEYIPEVRLTLEANPYFYAKTADGVQLPYLNEVVYLMVGNQNTERLKFEAGETDIYSPDAQNFPAIKAMSAEKGWNVIIGGPNLGSNFVAFNFNAQDPIKRKWFRNDEFRRAISYAFDRQSVIDNLYNGLGAAIYGPTSPTSGFYNPETEKLGLKFSISKAKRELKKGGFTWNAEGQLVDPDGNPVAFELVTNKGNPTREEIGNILKDSLEKLGIYVVFNPIQFNTLVNNIYGGSWDGMIIGLTGSNDPGSGWNVQRIDGGLHFWNYPPESQEWVDANDYFLPDYEKRIDEIFKKQVTTVNQEELVGLFNEFQMIMAERQVLIYTVTQNYLVAMTERVHIPNDNPNPVAGVLWKRHLIWVAE